MAAANTDVMKRFAFDVFVYTMSKFKTVTNIPTPKYSENTYEHPDFLLVLSRGYIPYQLEKRDTWKPSFEAKFKLNGLKKFKNIAELLDELLKEIDLKPKRNTMRRTIASLALINDLIQFLYSKNRRLFLDRLVNFWRNYFSYFEEEFEKEGGLSQLYSFHTRSSRDFHVVIDYFIPYWCFPYEREGVSKMFIWACLNHWHVYSLIKACDNIESKISALALSLKEQSSIASKSPRKLGDEETEASAALVNTGLGIPPHEDLLRDSYSLSADKETYAERHIASSIEEASSTAHADVKLHRKQFGQTSREQVKEPKHPNAEITCPDGRSKDQGDLPRSPLSPEGQSKGRGDLAASTSSPQEQNHRRGSPRTPQGISRLEQKRQKHRQPKKN